MESPDEISRAEARYRQKLEEFFTRVYPPGSLSSHGLDHHRRVWGYCMELLADGRTFHPESSASFHLQLLIAAYLHDSGMAIDPGPVHGHIGRKFAEQFIYDNKLNAGDFNEALMAIEQHDRKDYGDKEDPPALLSILSVADDLDALGYIGIYRYLEIYIERGIPYPELGLRIGSNVTARYNNLFRLAGKMDGFETRHASRFRIIRSFCDEFNDQAAGYRFGTDNPAGACGVAEATGLFAKKRIGVEDMIKESLNFKDPVINNFFNELGKELKAGQQQSSS